MIIPEHIKDYSAGTSSIDNRFATRNIWWFPKIGVPPVIIRLFGIFHERNRPATGVAS